MDTLYVIHYWDDYNGNLNYSELLEVSASEGDIYNYAAYRTLELVEDYCGDDIEKDAEESGVYLTLADYGYYEVWEITDTHGDTFDEIKEKLEKMEFFDFINYYCSFCVC